VCTAHHVITGFTPPDKGCKITQPSSRPESLFLLSKESIGTKRRDLFKNLPVGPLHFCYLHFVFNIVMACHELLEVCTSFGKGGYLDKTCNI
jgi:hypothetical protein